MAPKRKKKTSPTNDQDCHKKHKVSSSQSPTTPHLSDPSSPAFATRHKTADNVATLTPCSLSLDDTSPISPDAVVVPTTNKDNKGFVKSNFAVTHIREPHFHLLPKQSNIKTRLSNVHFSRLVIANANEKSLYAVIYPYYTLAGTHEQGSPPGASPFNENIKDNEEYRNQFNIRGIYFRKDCNGYAMSTNPTRKNSLFKAYQWLCMYNKDTFPVVKNNILQAMTKASSESENTNLSGSMFVENSDKNIGECCRYCDVFVQEDLIEIFKDYLVIKAVAIKSAQEIRTLLEEDTDFINYVKDVFGCSCIDQQLKTNIITYW